MKFDKTSPIPLYYQLAERLREQIATGLLKPGDQLPSERDLSEQASISRMTVRQAVSYLVNQGILVAKSGIGTFVVEPKLAHDPYHLLSFTEEMMRQGAPVHSRVLEQAVVQPPASVAVGLELQSATLAVKIVRLRWSQETPLLLETVYLPAALCPGLEEEDLTTQSLYALLEQRYDLRLKWARQTIEATVANDYEAELFGVQPGVGMILLEGVAYLDNDRPVEYFKAIYRGDRFKFALESRRNTWSNEIPGAPRIDVVLDHGKS
jgi:GntR family transcriptional regulator